MNETITSTIKDRSINRQNRRLRRQARRLRNHLHQQRVLIDELTVSLQVAVDAYRNDVIINGGGVNVTVNVPAPVVTNNTTYSPVTSYEDNESIVVDTSNDDQWKFEAEHDWTLGCSPKTQPV